MYLIKNNSFVFSLFEVLLRGACKHYAPLLAEFKVRAQRLLLLPSKDVTCSHRSLVFNADFCFMLSLWSFHVNDLLLLKVIRE